MKISKECRHYRCASCLAYEGDCDHACHLDGQGDLFAQSPDVRDGRHRRNDHPTSVAGAHDVAYRAGSQKARLTVVYKDAYPNGLSDEEAARAAGLPLTSCYWKRCGELRQDGVIADTGQTRIGSAGVPRIVSRWVLNG